MEDLFKDLFILDVPLFYIYYISINSFALLYLMNGMI